MTKFLFIGGHTRNIGKTSLMVDIIRAFPAAAWTAVKITQYGHGVCSTSGEACGCAPSEHTVALDEETNRDNRTDTSRFLVAGAARSLWLRTKQGRLAESMPLLRDALRDAEHAIIESNSLMNFIRPALYLVVLDPSAADFKDSARQHLDQADAFILRSPVTSEAWQAISPRLIEAQPHFFQRLGAPLPEGLRNLLMERYFRPAVQSVQQAAHLSS